MIRAFPNMATLAARAAAAGVHRRSGSQFNRRQRLFRATVHLDRIRNGALLGSFR